MQKEPPPPLPWELSSLLRAAWGPASGLGFDFIIEGELFKINTSQ